MAFSSDVGGLRGVVWSAREQQVKRPSCAPIATT
jgi:hypothetical protein